MSENALIKISEMLKEFADILVELFGRMQEDDYKYFDLVRKHAELQVQYERLEREKDQIE